jgi:L-alanine-DL-glutamate epimerase-like enolase superfamily enzyme
MHRSQVHGRQGETMMAISAIDCALWDLKGKYFGVPVYVLLGGPTRQKVPAYASMLGFNVTDMGKVKERALEYKKKGYTAQKWFFRYGPMSGYEGLKKNVEMVKAVRETVGDDYDIMLDCWQSMDIGYVLKLIKNIEDYNPAWLEECVMPDRVSSYRKIREKTSIPLSGAEHEYTRWGFKRFIDQEALDILQPDIYWAGGLSETLKIATLGTAADLITIPHGHSTQAGTHFSVTQSPIHTPYQEYLIKWNVIHQHFLKDPVVPIRGNIKIPTIPGMAMDLDPEKIQKEEEFLPQ